ncbi:MAG: aspartate-semialdehyde dehydrogenase [Candidatus Bathyarchaeia archaeon]
MLKVAVLGATGMVGQKFIELLEDHPWFRVEAVAASERSVGLRYGELAKWRLPTPIPDDVKDLEVLPVDVKALDGVDVVYSALPAEEAGRIEEDFARAGYIVFSNASSHRMDDDVPILNPEVNHKHASIIDEQRKRRGWSGAIVTNPNCTTAILTLSLKPVMEEFGIERVFVSTMQALSGAGYPGVASLDIEDNVIPFIKNEEEKVQRETLKIMGGPGRPADFRVSASCHRVNTTDGHTEAVFVETKREAEVEEVIEAMSRFQGEPQRLKLPTAPRNPIVVRREEDRPQPRLDRMEGRGMAVVVGRIRADTGLDGFKYIVLGHNTVRGAAGCSILNSEYLKAIGYI